MRGLLLKKLVNGMRRQPGQFLMMAAAVFASVFALATMLNALGMINASTAAAYMGTNPAQATIEVAGAKALPDAAGAAAIADSIGLGPGVESERRGTVVGRIDDGKGRWYPLVLFVMEDFAAMRVGKFLPDSGAWPPRAGTMLLERTAMAMIGRAAGEAAAVMLPGLATKRVPLSGTAHDPGLAPAWQERTVYGYVDLATASALYGSAFPLDELKLVFGPAAPRADISAEAERYAAALAAKGYAVHEIQVPPPATHPHQSQMNTILGIFLAFSLLALALAGILIAVLAQGILRRETRLIGIMKTVGAGPGRLVPHYLGLAAIPAAFGMALALPLGLLAARGLTGLITQLLNLGSADSGIAPIFVLLPLVAGILIPCLIALIPVARAGRITIREALAGPASAPPKKRDSKLRLPRLLSMALRNIGRRPSRLALNLALLAAAGALFIASLDIGQAYRATLAKAGEGRVYDLELRLDGALDSSKAVAAFAALPGVARAEGWDRVAVYPSIEGAYPVTLTYPDKGHGSFFLRGVPEGAGLFAPRVVAGDFSLLQRKAAGGRLPIALNQSAAAQLPPASVGDVVTLRVNGARAEFVLVALVREIGQASAWTGAAMLDAIPGCASAQSNDFYVRLAPGAADPAAIIRSCEAAVVAVGGRLEMAIPQEELDSALGGHVWTLIYALGAMAVVIGMVGLLGLASATGTSVLERRREIAVMRSIGGGPGTIRLLVLAEAALQGLAGFVVALVASIPLALALGNIIGMMSFRTPLEPAVDPAGIWTWAAILVAGSLLSSLVAALRAASGTIREDLAYE